MNLSRRLTLSPKAILWLAFGMIAGTWYVLDPDAHIPLNPSVAGRASTPIEQLVQAAAPAIQVKTAWN
jgi:hypothetical protein